MSRALTLLVLASLAGATSVATATEAPDRRARKAEAFLRALHDRHLSPEGTVLYRIDLSTAAADLASGRYPPSADVPTFTGIFAAMSCLRAEVPGEREAALRDARKGLAGLQLLMDVTGRRGLLARALRRDAGREPASLALLGGEWHAALPPFERFAFRGDASQDQYANGLLFAVAACRGLFPGEARSLISDFAAHLLENRMRIVDVDGQPTRFGQLGPFSALGWNAIALLTSYATFALAEELAPDAAVASKRRELRDRFRVVARARLTNLRVLGLTSRSNELMTFHLLFALLPWARSQGDPTLPDLRHTLARSWLRVREDQNPYFAALVCRTDPSLCDRRALAAGWDLLGDFPLEKSKHPPDPALLALPRRWLPARKGAREARTPVPIELRSPSSFEWKSSPLRLDGGGDPNTEYTGLDFLAAYWLYRTLPGYRAVE